MKGAISVFNLSNEHSVQDIVRYFGAFGQIEEVEQISQKQNNSTLKQLATAKSVFPSARGSSSTFPQFFNQQNFASVLPKGYENKFGIVIHYSEFDDAEEAARNLNGIEWNGSQIFVGVVKQSTESA